MDTVQHQFSFSCLPIYSCDPGHYNPMMRDSAYCFQCPQGHFAADNSVSCTACGAGKKIVDQSKGSETFACASCQLGKYSKVSASTSCDDCEPGKSTSSEGSATCEVCEDGKITATPGKLCQQCPDEHVSKFACNVLPTTCDTCPEDETNSEQSECFRCKEGEYKSGGGCKKCNQVGIIISLVFCLVVFTVATLYVSSKSHHQEQMIRIKVISNFFQVSELTTMVSLPWPPFVKWTLPLQFPTSDTDCLTSTGWNLIVKFYFFIYLPIAIFLILIGYYFKSPKRSLRRESIMQMVIFLMTLYYSPVLQGEWKG